MSSVQFRSRIKPAINYSNVLNSYGYCCKPGQTPAVKKSYLECFNEGGYFIQSDSNNPPTCPDPETQLGCCCACSYVTQGELSLIPAYPLNGQTPYLASGTLSGISKCECDRLGGKWTPEQCNPLTAENFESYCVSDNQDARAPRSCCHMDFDETSGLPTNIKCVDVCTSYECGLLSTSTYPSVYGGNNDNPIDDTRCLIELTPGGPFKTEDCIISQSDVVITASNVDSNFTINTIIPKTSESVNDNKTGSCFELKGSYRNYTYDCRVSRESDCNGYWIEAQGSTNQYCEIEYKPSNPVKVIGGGYDVQRMSFSSFNNFGLTSGDEFQGGIFIGIFKTPHSGKSSEVYGDITFTRPELSRFESDGIGNKKDTQWALIVEKNLFYAPFLKVNEIIKNPITSLYDGYYNTYGDNQTFAGIQTALINTIKFLPRNGFIDYYLPSIYELNFYAAFLRKNDITNRLRQTLLSSSIFNTKYMGSKRKVTNLYNTNFVYNLDINFSQAPFYKNVLTDVYSTENVRFFRRIVLT